MTSNEHEPATAIDDDELDEEDRGLRYDLPKIVGRRRILALGTGVASMAVLAACGGTGPSSTSSSRPEPAGRPPGGGAGGPDMGSNDDLVDGEVPSETSGPYPGDGSNGVDVLTDDGIVRSDITSSLDGGSTADGVPLTFRITVRDVSTGRAMTGAGVYAWHCDRESRYSMYSSGAENETYLRGVQGTDEDGTVEFVSIFPACYSGRWPHIHFEVYESVETAVAQDGDNPIVKTSQIALPQEACERVYATAGYESSVTNLAQVSLSSDGVFGDDAGIHQIATMTGNTSDGYVASLNIGVVAG